MDDDGQAHLHGRIAALEMLMVGAIVNALKDDADPAAEARRLRRGFLGSLQLVDRDIGEYEDRVWAAATDGLNEIFDNVESRIAHLSRRPG